MKIHSIIRYYVLLLLLTTGADAARAASYSLSSPDGKLKVEVNAGGRLTFQLWKGGKAVTDRSDIGMTLYDGTVIGTKVTGKPETKSTTEKIVAPMYRQREFSVAYNQMTLPLNGRFGVVFRAYDSGVAYRFFTTRKGTVTVKDETVRLRFAQNDTAWLAYSTNDKKPMAMAFQNIYDKTPLTGAKDKIAFLPATVQTDGVKVTLLEAELRAYPGMYVKADTTANALYGVFAPYPARMDYYPWRRQMYVAEPTDFIARSTGARQYPWRILTVTEKDTEMPVNNLVYALSEPNRIGDTSWIRPGKVAWDWWNDWNLKGVPFKAGINTETYKYYIDFASHNHLGYIILDEGWYDSKEGDIMHAVKDIDLPALIAYGKERKVDIILWAVFNVLDEHLEEALTKYSKMGVKGFKIDFLDRDDQTATEMAYRIAEAAAKHHLVLDFHGYYKPTGMSRTYPNILNYEGVFGMEEARWTKKENNMPLYDVTFPYIRGMAGQVDFTPGAMSNGTLYNWTAIYTKPMSMGTRCHQLACYIVQDSPLTMLCDAPTNYEREQECTDMIASIPVTFDRTVIPQGEMGKYIVTARQKGDNWYVGAQAGWDGRDICLPLDFLAPGKSYRATIFRDGINADHNAEDYVREVKTVDRQSTLEIRLASGGGCVIKIETIK